MTRSQAAGSDLEDQTWHRLYSELVSSIGDPRSGPAVSLALQASSPSNEMKNTKKSAKFGSCLSDWVRWFSPIMDANFDRRSSRTISNLCSIVLFFLCLNSYH